MIPPAETHGLRRRSFVSGLSLVAFGLSIGSVGLIAGCGDEKGNMTQVENPENPADKAKDSMNFYKNDQMKKAAGAAKKR
jgi:hypothetical protein